MTAEEAYVSIQDLINKLCWKHCKKTGDDFDDSLQSARLCFLKQYPKFDSEKASLCTWTYNTITWEYKSRNRKKILNKKREGSQYNDDKDIRSIHSISFMPDLIDELSEDALTIVSLILDSPSSLQSCIKGHGKSKACIRVLRGYLLGMDWSRPRISKAFYQIKKAIR